MSTVPTATSTRWVRAPRIPTASRTDGLSVTLDNGRWVANMAGKPAVLATPGLASYLERALVEADEAHPPAPWAFVDGVWRCHVWEIRPNGDGTWGIFRTLEGEVEQASRQPFPSADRARRWAELRFDRGETRLRGPKPRAGSKAAHKLPDIRVTEAEKSHVFDLLGRLGLGYSDFVRAAMFWAESNLVEATPEDGAGEARTWEVVEREGGGYAFVPVEPAV
jgi:hypothetical protein